MKLKTKFHARSNITCNHSNVLYIACIKFTYIDCAVDESPLTSLTVPDLNCSYFSPSSWFDWKSLVGITKSHDCITKK